MSKSFEVTWNMYGTATIIADSMDDAIRRASSELIDWRGMGLEVDELCVDGVDVDS